MNIQQQVDTFRTNLPDFERLIKQQVISSVVNIASKKNTKMQEQVDIYKQLQNDMLEIDLYKIFGESRFTFQSAYAESIKDWSAFYTQLVPEHSMRYLTKKWNDGSDYACLLKLKISKKPLNIKKLIKVSHPLLSKHSVHGQIKAQIIKNHLTQKYGIYFSDKNQPWKPLMKVLGENGIILQCVDSQQEQIIIPHDLLNQANFQYTGLAIFKKSQDGMLRTVAWREYLMNEKEDKEEEAVQWHRVMGDAQFQPYVLLKTNQQFKNYFQKL